ILDEGKIDLGPDSSKEKMIKDALGEKDEKSDSEFVDENEVSSGKSKSSFAANPETKGAKVLAENTEGTLGRSLFSGEDDDKEKSKETVVSPDYVKDGASSYGYVAEYDEVAASTAGTVDPPEAKGDMVAGIGTKVKTSFYGVSDPDFNQFPSVSCELKKCGLERKHLGEVFRDRSPALQLLDKVTDQIAVEDSVDLSYAAVGPLDFVAVEEVLEKQSGEGSWVLPSKEAGEKKQFGYWGENLPHAPQVFDERSKANSVSGTVNNTTVQVSSLSPVAARESGDPQPGVGVLPSGVMASEEGQTGQRTASSEWVKVRKKRRASRVVNQGKQQDKEVKSAEPSVVQGDKKPATLARGFCAAQLDALPRRLARPDFRHGSSAIGHTGVPPSLSAPLASCLGQPPESQCASRHLMARARGAPPW
ncbi:hypothetical protein U1Q18_036459, partial [Sarracenia purpurea var. burkii]